MTIILIILIVGGIIAAVAIFTSNQSRREEEKRKQREEEIEQERLEKEQYCENLNTTFSKIGGTVQMVNSGYIVTAQEDVNVKKLFQYIENYAPSNSFFQINDLHKNPLVYFSFRELWGREHKWNICTFVFSEDGAANKTFKEEDEEDCKKKAEKFLFCYLRNRKIQQNEKELSRIIQQGVKKVSRLNSIYGQVVDYTRDILYKSDYKDLFEKNIETGFDNGMLVIDYELPSKDGFCTVKEYKYTSSTNEISKKPYPESIKTRTYENALYAICLRSIYEIFATDKNLEIESATFNGFVTATNKATGKMERKCVLSIQVSKEAFTEIDILNVDPKACFKALKGVSAAKLIDLSPVTPVLTFDKNDHRFIEERNVETHSGTNLASMAWEDFEQLVRDLFEMEFAKNGGEVKVTQASRDGGVDAVIFDPDPIRGGRIVVQAKRYTNTVPVSAVRDLYGTVINEGANSGILITTSDYGFDSYEFAKGKPLKLLNGGHLLALLQQNGRSGYINIAEAKEINRLQEE